MSSSATPRPMVNALPSAMSVTAATVASAYATAGTMNRARRYRSDTYKKAGPDPTPKVTIGTSAQSTPGRRPPPMRNPGMPARCVAIIQGGSFTGWRRSVVLSTATRLSRPQPIRRRARSGCTSGAQAIPIPIR